METNVFNQWIGGACGCSENISPCNTVFQKVDELPALGDATRNHAYILPNNTVWVVNSEGTDFSQLNGGSGAGGAYDDTELRGLIQQALDRNTMEDNRLVNIENKNATQDQRLTALENKNTEYDGYFEELSEVVGELQGQTGGGTSYDDTAIKQRLDAVENKNTEQDTGLEALEDAFNEFKEQVENTIDTDTTYTAGSGISISEDNVIINTSQYKIYRTERQNLISDTAGTIGVLYFERLSEDTGRLTVTIDNVSNFTGRTVIDPTVVEELVAKMDFDGVAFDGISSDINAGIYYSGNPDDQNIEITDLKQGYQQFSVLGTIDKV